MNVCVFCGSSPGLKPIYSETAKQLGKLLAEAGHTLVYGGGKVGLMGIVADSVLTNQGSVIGVIPDFLLKKEVGHSGLTQLVVVDSMHERKKRMADLSEAFVAIPGGMGTLDELAEILTWKQLHLINNPIILLNTNNFFDHLISQMKVMVTEGFLQENNFSSIHIVSSPVQLLSVLQ